VFFLGSVRDINCIAATTNAVKSITHTNGFGRSEWAKDFGTIIIIIVVIVAAASVD
jgi:hypothetical protein